MCRIAKGDTKQKGGCQSIATTVNCSTTLQTFSFTFEGQWGWSKSTSSTIRKYFITSTIAVTKMINGSERIKNKVMLHKSVFISHFLGWNMWQIYLIRLWTEAVLKKSIWQYITIFIFDMSVPYRDQCVYVIFLLNPHSYSIHRAEVGV